MPRALLALLVLALLQGCASASLSRVVVHAPVPVEVVEKDTGRTLTRDWDDGVLLDHRRDHVLTVSAEGYEPAELVLASRTSGLRITKTVLCSLFPLYTLIGLPYDLYGSRWRALDPDEVTVQLIPLKRP